MTRLQSSLLTTTVSSKMWWYIVTIISPCFFTGAVVGLEQTLFRVVESASNVEVCAHVSYPRINCPIKFYFNVGLRTTHRSAGLNTQIIRMLTVMHSFKGLTVQFAACDVRKCVSVSVADYLPDSSGTILNFSLTRTANLSPRIELGSEEEGWLCSKKFFSPLTHH